MPDELLAQPRTKPTYYMKLAWWKTLALVLIAYTVVGGFLIDVPRLAILNESIRNQFFHVPMWFAMLLILTASVYHSVRYLCTPHPHTDRLAAQATHMGIVFGLLGIMTGSVWARFTWGAWWVNDPKLNAAAIALLIYLAYLVLRNSFEDDTQRARISAVYNIFAYATLVPLLFILPRMTDSLHPGNGGNPGFSAYDMDATLRMVFYPAVVGWTLLGWWIVTLWVRLRTLAERRADQVAAAQARRPTATVRPLLTLAGVLLAAAAHAQDGDRVEMADALRDNGKIYVVVAVVAIIMAGLLAYLIRLDRKIAHLEKDLADSDSSHA